MNLVEHIYEENINHLERKIQEFSTEHNVLSISVYNRGEDEWLQFAAFIVYSK